jgi:hypothetical protein
MRKSAPALILTTLIAFASTSALALGDRAKEKKASDAAATPSSQPAPAKPANGMTSGTENKSQVAQNDARCDESKYPSRSAMPKECFDKTSTGAAATSGTQGQSSGDSGPSGAGASSSPSSSPSSSSSSPSK